MSKQDALDSIFDGLSSKLQAEFDFLSSQFTHRPSKGMAREYVLKELLRQHLPQKLGIGSGMVISSDGVVSKQMDIVIYDALNTPIMYAASDIQIFPVECVYAVIEVKSLLNSSELRKSTDNIRSIKNMSKVAYVTQQSPITSTVTLYGQELSNFPVLGFVFAYSSINNIKQLKDKLVELDDNSSVQNNIDSICILNKATITNWQASTDKLWPTKEPDSVRTFIITQKSLLLFYLQLMHILPQTWMQPIQMTKYAEHVVYGVRGL